MSPLTTTFVGRRELLDRFLKDLQSAGRLRADVVTGVLGMGKSSLLLHAADLESARDGAFDALYVDLTPYGLGGGRDEHPNFGAAVQDYELFSAFVRVVLSGLAPEGLPKLEAARKKHQARFREVKTLILNVYALNEVGDHSTVTSSGTTVNTEDTPRGAVDSAYIQESRGWIEEERDILVQALNTRKADRAAMLLLDNVDAVLDRNFSTYLSVALSRLEGAAVVLAQEPGTSSLLPGTAAAVPVPPLREVEVRELLQAELVGRPSWEELVPLVHTFSGGVPVAVKALIDLLNDHDESLETATLEERLRRLPRDPESRLAEVVTTMEEHYQGRPLGVALRAASVPDWCDAPLLGKLLPVEGVAADRAPELLKELGDLNVTTEPEVGAYRVEIHPFIRRGLLEGMRKFRPTERAKYHAIVADHFYQLLTDSESGAYGDMFALEQPRQQELLRQWLKHLGASADVRVSVLQAARVFFDAMWWWGNYVELEFCETLATDFESYAEASQDETFLGFARAVRAFLGSYPFRARLRQDFDHGYPPAEWDTVQEQLFQVQGVCGLLNMPAQPSRLEGHVKALTEVFLAHTYRYSTDPDHEEGLACYARAHECFHAVGRWWDLPWVTFESADLTLESGDINGARARAARAVDELHEHLDPAQPDEELMANLHRLRGDCAWQEGNVLPAAREYGLAVMHSYLFHLIGGPPDDYTMQFYFEIRGRALQRVAGLWLRGEESLAMAATIEMRRAAWGRAAMPIDEVEVVAALRDARLADLALILFPRGPDVAELGESSSSFTAEHHRFHRKVSAASLHDLTDGAPDPVPEDRVES